MRCCPPSSFWHSARRNEDDGCQIVEAAVPRRAISTRSCAGRSHVGAASLRRPTTGRSAGSGWSGYWPTCRRQCTRPLRHCSPEETTTRWRERSGALREDWICSLRGDSVPAAGLRRSVADRYLFVMLLWTTSFAMGVPDASRPTGIDGEAPCRAEGEGPGRGPGNTGGGSCRSRWELRNGTHIT